MITAKPFVFFRAVFCFQGVLKKSFILLNFFTKSLDIRLFLKYLRIVLILSFKFILSSVKPPASLQAVFCFKEINRS